MKTVFYESLSYKLITKNDFYYGSCPDIHFNYIWYISKEISENSITLNFALFIKIKIIGPNIRGNI